MNHYYTSDGERISQDTIDRRIRNAKRVKLEQQRRVDGYNFCEDCGRSGGTYLDCSHDKPVSKCKDDREAERAYDLDNITIRCRSCHEKYDKLSIAPWGLKQTK